MPSESLNRWMEHLPDYQGRRIYILLLRIPIYTIIFLAFLILGDIGVRYLPSSMFLKVIEPIIPVLLSSSFLVGGFEIVHKFWNKKTALLATDRKYAYQKAILYPFTGIPMIFAVLIHEFFPLLYLPFNLISLAPPINPITSIMSNSILSLWIEPTLVMIIRIIIGICIILIAILSGFRSSSVFGVDYALLTYVYYPEKGEVQKKGTYSIVRHPMYVGVYLLAIAAFILRFSVYTCIFLVISSIMLNHHINVEDNDLIERFGKNYLSYRSNVPGFLIRPKNWKKFLKYLITGSV